MELIQGSETSANYNLTPGKYPKENIQYSNHDESLKSRINIIVYMLGMLKYVYIKHEYCLCFFLCSLFCYVASISVYNVKGGMTVIYELEKIWKEVIMA